MNVIRQMMLCTLYMSSYYLYVFIKIIDNKKLEESDETDDDVYILDIKRYAIRTYSELRR
jgi:hypothetical protein